MKTKNMRTVAVLLLLTAFGIATITAVTVSVAQMEKQYQFSIPRKAAHWESNSPMHGQILTAPPDEILITANMDMGPGNYIKVMKDGKDYGMGDTVLDDNKLSTYRKVDPNAPNGMYTVEYQLCWPDGTCHQGNYQFAIER